MMHKISVLNRYAIMMKKVDVLTTDKKDQELPLKMDKPLTGYILINEL